MHTLWYDDAPGFHGRFVDFAVVNAQPRPVEQPIPLVVAGHSRPAHRRAVAWAHGWCGYSLTPGDVADAIAGLRRAADHVDRPVELGEMEISVTPRGQLTAERVAAYAEVHRLVMLSPPTPDGQALKIKAAVAAVGDV